MTFLFPFFLLIEHAGKDVFCSSVGSSFGRIRFPAFDAQGTQATVQSPPFPSIRWSPNLGETETSSLKKHLSTPYFVVNEDPPTDFWRTDSLSCLSFGRPLTVRAISRPPGTPSIKFDGFPGFPRDRNDGEVSQDSCCVCRLPRPPPVPILRFLRVQPP